MGIHDYTTSGEQDPGQPRLLLGLDGARRGGSRQGGHGVRSQVLTGRGLLE